MLGPSAARCALDWCPDPTCCAGDLKASAAAGDRVCISSDPFYSLPTRGKVRRAYHRGDPHGRRGGQSSEARWGRSSENWMLQTHRGLAAAAPASAPAPGEMLMGFCRPWRVIGRREFGATSTAVAIGSAQSAVLCRELPTPPPLSPRLPLLAAGPPPGTLPPRRRSGRGRPSLGMARGCVPAQDWPRAIRKWRALGSFPGKSGETTRRPLRTTHPSLPARLDA